MIENSNNFEKIQNKDEEQEVQKNDTTKHSLDDCIIKAKGKVAKYNIFYFDNYIKRQRKV